MEINYLVAWNKNKKLTWSGTCWSLREAFIRNGISIKDHNIINKKPKIYLRLLKKLRINKKIDDLNLHNIINNRRNLSFLNKSPNKIIFQFGEYIQNSKYIKSFIYLDMDVLSVEKLHDTDKKAFNFSNYRFASSKSIQKRAKSQLDYFKTCSGIFTMGKWLKKEIEKKTQIKAPVYSVGAGINLDPSIIDDSYKTNNKFLFVGRDFKRKGGYLVYKAFEKLHKNNPNLELYVAGPKSNPIDTPCEGYHFCGDCTYEKTAQLYNKCDVFCLPSYFEAYGIAFIEALTFGLPCIGRRCQEMPYFIEENVTGYCIDDDNIDYLAQKMESLLTNKQIFQNVKQKRSWYLKEYSWDEVAKRIINTINETTGNNSIS